MPTNEKILDDLGNETDKYKYKFSKFQCTDSTIVGQFDEEEWKFVPNEEKESICNLFFVNSTYEVTLTITNGKADDNNPKYITLKLNPIDGEFFRNSYEDIIPGYYMNKAHWNSIKADGDVPDDVIKELLDKSYDEILNKFTKKKRAEILSL